METIAAAILMDNNKDNKVAKNVNNKNSHNNITVVIPQNQNKTTINKVADTTLKVDTVTEDITKNTAQALAVADHKVVATTDKVAMATDLKAAATTDKVAMATDLKVVATTDKVVMATDLKAVALTDKAASIEAAEDHKAVVLTEVEEEDLNQDQQNHY